MCEVTVNVTADLTASYPPDRALRGMLTLARDLRQILPVLADREFAFVAMVALGLAGAVLEAIAVSLISALIYLSLGGAGQPGPVAMPRHLFPFDPGQLFREHLWLFCAIVVAAAVLRAAAVALYGVVATALKSLVFHRLRMRLYHRFMFAPFEDISRASFGFLTNTLQVEAPRVAELIDQLFRMPVNLCGAAVFFLVLVMLSWPVAGVAAVAGLALTAVLQLSGGYLHRLSQRMLMANEDLASRMLAGIHALRTIRAFGAEQREFGRFIGASNAVARMTVRFAAFEHVITPSTTLAALFMIAAVVGFSNALGNTAVTTLMIVAVLFRMQPQLQGLQSSLTSIHGLESSLALVARIVNEDVQIAPRQGNAVESPALLRSIQFRDVSYRHPLAAEPTLAGLNFEIPRGRVTAISGRSGAGKTTILNLLLRLTEPSAGVIEVDGIPLASIDRLSWLRRVAITGQDIDMLSGSILENLRLGRPDLSAADAMAALAVAGIDEFVQTLPDGLETRVGERGHRLSGGQRQRIALARAIVMRPDLLIMDEATNAVDAALEVAIFRQLRAAFPDLTIVIIAHRGSGAEAADVVINLADGRVRSVKHQPRVAVS